MDGVLATVMLFAGNFAPRNWALCNGQLLAINSNTALFSIIGTYYGGDGRTTFGLPNLQGRIPMGAGNGAGLTPRSIGQTFGSQTNTLNSLQLPAHNHLVTGSVTIGVNEEDSNSDSASGSILGPTSSEIIYNSGAPSVGERLGGVSHNLQTGFTGNNSAINNIQPVQVLNYVICTYGVYPSRN